jgi:DNA-binding HxlR family transcriptional regulator
MLHGDLIWEVAGKSYRSLYNEKLGRQQRVPALTVEEMEQRGWIRRLDNPHSSRLDGWELTEQGRALAAPLRARRQAKPEASSLAE